MWERALRRAGVGVVYSEGFSPRPQSGLRPGPAHRPRVRRRVPRHRPDRRARRTSPLLCARLSDVPARRHDVAAAEVIPPGTPSLQEAVGACTWTAEIDGPTLKEATAAVAATLARRRAPHRAGAQGQGPGRRRPAARHPRTDRGGGGRRPGARRSPRSWPPVRHRSAPSEVIDVARPLVAAAAGVPKAPMDHRRGHLARTCATGRPVAARRGARVMRRDTPHARGPRRRRRPSSTRRRHEQAPRRAT